MPRKAKLPSGMQVRKNKKGEDVYYANFRAQGRKIRKRLSSNFQAAKELLAELKARANRADFGLVDNDFPWSDLRAEFLRWARQAVRNPQEYASDLDKLEEYLQVRTVNQITPEVVFGFREWRLAQPGRGGRTVSPRTINRQVSTLTNMLNRGVEWGRIGSNPVADIKPLANDDKAKQRRALSAEEIELIFTESPAHLRPVWMMFCTTGIRRGELVGMRFADVDFEGRCVTVRSQLAKNHRERTIPLDDGMLATIEALRDAAADRQPVDGPTTKQTRQQHAAFSREQVFVTNANTPLRNNLLKRFYAICKRAGIEGAEPNGTVDIHALRGSFITITLENGATPKAIQEIVGHRSLELTMNTYAKVTDRAKRDAIGTLPFANSSDPDHIIAVDFGAINGANGRTMGASDSGGDSEQPGDMPQTQRKQG